MRVILTIAVLGPEYGGPSRSVPALAEAVARQRATAEIITCEAETGQEKPLLPDSALVRTTLVPARAWHGRWIASQNDFFITLRERFRNTTNALVHDNALWLPTNHAVACAAASLRIPRIVSPRGMLSTWATQHHRWKKKVAWMLFQRRDLERASVLHATSEAEAAEFRRAGLRQPIAIIPNGVDLPTKTKAESVNGSATRDRTALFLSRVHPKKGLLDLVGAWAQVRPRNWKMVIAGNDEGGHQREVEAAIDYHDLSAVFSFLGPVRDEAKWELYRGADLFVLPSYSENFGIVVAEALASGLPVITTRGTPWGELAEHRAGWWIDPGVEPLTEALRIATKLNDEELVEMGNRGRALVESNYSWSSAAMQMKAVYSWMLDGGEPPACVVKLS